MKLECIHRVRTHAVLLLSVSPPSEYRMTTKCGCNVIVVVSPPSECEKNAIVVGNEVLLCSVIDPVTFEPQNSNTSRVSQSYSLHQV